MNKANQFTVLIILLLSIVISQSCNTTPPRKNFAVVFYNCENFFDTINNPNTNDDEFTPSGKYHYTQKIYEQKLHNIATVFQTIGTNPNKALPVLIGLSEIENNTVLDDLTSQPELKKRNYKHILYEGHDMRGINVGLLYDPQYFKVITSAPIAITLPHGDTMPTRNILHVSGVLGKDSVHVFVNHWPSRRNDEQTEINHEANKRIIVATILKEQISNILKTTPNSKIIVMGDFNDNPTDSSINNLIHNTSLSNPFTELYQKGEGTEHYQQEWNLFDQVLLSNSLVNPSNPVSLRYKEATIYKPDFITANHNGKEALPRRAYAGTHWNNGYSDHFPVIVYLGRD
jgi:endonuclease/exonuclease/phosphatase family metal-dependent hydrolase